MAEKKKEGLVELEDGVMVDPVTGLVAEEAEELEEELYDESGTVDSGVLVYREKLKPRNKGDKPVFTYKVRGEIRGQVMDATVTPADRGGYRLLAPLFGDATCLPLLMVPYEMKDDHGKKVSGFTYKVSTTDENGITLECKMKPGRDSDKRILDCLIQIAQRQVKPNE